MHRRFRDLDNSQNGSTGQQQCDLNCLPRDVYFWGKPSVDESRTPRSEEVQCFGESATDKGIRPLCSRNGHI